MNRRDFMKLSGLAGIPLFAPKLVFGGLNQSEPCNVMVCVYQRGAADGLNLVVPYTEGRYYDLRPTIAIPGPESAGGAIDLDGFFGFHPDMGSLMPIYQSGDLAVVHATGSPDDSRSHFDAQDFMEKGTVSNTSVFDGWLNRHLQLTTAATESPFRAVGIGQSLQLALQGTEPAIGLASLAGFDVLAPAEFKADYQELLLDLYSDSNALDIEANNVFSAVDELEASNAADIPVANGAQYPNTNFGQQMMGLAQLIKANIGLEVACVDIGGWDHHDAETQALDGLLGDYSDALAAFHQDLGDLMQQVTVVTMTEFGRRAQENASLGTDHGHASIMLAMGGGVNGGQVFADWPGLDPADLNRGDLEVTIDYRTVLSDVLVNRFNNASIDQVFPDFSGPTSMGLTNPAVSAAKLVDPAFRAKSGLR